MVQGRGMAACSVLIGQFQCGWLLTAPFSWDVTCLDPCIEQDRPIAKVPVPSW